MRAVRAWAPLVLAGALLAGCGGDGRGGGEPEPTTNGVSALSAEEVLDRAKAALTDAKSYRIKADVTGDDKETFSLDVGVSGDDLKGSVSFGGATVELLAVAGQKYIKPDEALWRQTNGRDGEQIAEVLGDRWVLVQNSWDDIAEFFEIVDPGKLLEADGTLRKGETKEVQGTQAIGLTVGGDTLWVATTGEPYPLQLEGQSRLTYSDFGVTIEGIQAPAEEDVVDMRKLRSGG